MSRPCPLVPSDVDLTDFPFMPLLIARLKQSRSWLICKRRPELAFYMVNLWTASWHARPAASLENDDDVLADVAMCSPKVWKAIKADVLRGWVECEDDRVYHPVVAEQALCSWAKKVAQRQRTEAARRERAARRGGKEGATGTSVTDTVTTPVTASVTDNATDYVTGSKGQGESRDRENPPKVPLTGDSPPAKPRRKARPAGELCPEDFKPSESHYAKAAEWGRDRAWVDGIAERMRSWSQANANRETAWKANWAQALYDWLRDHRADGQGIVVQPGPGQRPALTNGATSRPTSGAPSMAAGLDAAADLLLRRQH